MLFTHLKATRALQLARGVRKCESRAEPPRRRQEHALSMFGLRLLVMAWAGGLRAFASAPGSSVEPLGAADECARCFAENERLRGRIEQLVARVGQLEAELAAQRGDWQGGDFFHARKILILAAVPPFHSVL